MNILKSIVALSLACLSAGAAYSQHANHPARGAAPQPHFDHRFDHDRSYPPRGAVVRELPHGAYDIYHRGSPYYFHGGAWYRPYRSHFRVVGPPFGIVIPVLPAFYTTIWLHGVPYYYADETYYVWDSARSGYVVTEPPTDIETAATSSSNDELFVYPKKGQSEAQQATDRYECHRWAADQTGFDPTRPADSDQATASTKRAAYRRAQGACLEARGYSVK